jgi:dTDP-4-amino-4,6-dideoxygalactose transaminase
VKVPFADLGRATQTVRPDLDAAVARVLHSGWFVLGSEGSAFEDEFAQAVGVAHAVAVGSGTDAIELALRALGIGRGDEVVTQANTCVPTVAAIERAGATPVLCDVEPESATIDPASLRATITPRTRAVVPVHLYGQVGDLGAVVAACQPHDIAVLEDCAQAHGATYDGQPAGTIGAAGAFSFYPTKNLGAYGDGGAVATRDAAAAGRARELRQYGWTRRDFAEHEGRNSRLDEIQAAILRAKLATLDAENRRRREIAERYDAAFAGLPLRLLRTRAHTVPSRHLYPVRVERGRRDAFQAHLASRGVETRIHYPVPLHLQPAYAFLGHRRGDFPVSEEACDTIVSLPIYPTLSEAQVAEVIEAVRGFFDANPGSRP